MSISNRLFIRLYLIVVASVILAGLGVDYIWQSYYSTQTETTSFEKNLLLTAKLIEQSPDLQKQQVLDYINQTSEHQVALIDISQIQANELLTALQHGEIITLNNESGSKTSYIQLSGQQKLIAIETPQVEVHQVAKTIWLFIFYSIIAGVIYLWTLPLSNDLKKIENAAKAFSQSKWDAKVDIAKGSPVRHLARAYNHLLFKIKQLLKDQQAMSHAISHELRTPLARIKFSIEIAKETTDTHEVQQQILSISDDINEIQQLVDELLGYATLEKHSVTANMEKGNIKYLVANLTEKLQRNSPDKQIAINIHSPIEEIYCDSYLIERALQNLILNAQKFCCHQVQITFQQKNQNNQLIVEDDGEGIPGNKRQRIFDSFVRLNNNQQKQHKGFGLGLAIVKRIAQLHQGKALVEKSDLGGAKFIIQWPKNNIK
ncbi:ATP-binding protein [Aliikangiella maris]|uniref:histidine kinase n=2 Tax=Aliikangiella maris TaxID=3162458 RepID=A0ABV2BV07_9GAMM